MEIAADLVPIKFLPARVDVEQRADGTLVLRSPEPLRPYARCLGEYLERWAAEKPNEVFLAQREGEARRGGRSLGRKHCGKFTQSPLRFSRAE